jgi:riboflavin kinase/FMN adenylyltransferase
VRAALADGDVALAARLLGRPWRVRETVVHGDKRGRLLGFPTANMVLPPETGLRYGIYAVEVRVDGVWRPGAASFGKRPTFDDGAPRLESFLLDFSGDLYGRRLDVRFIGWVRGEERFAGVEALVAQMNRDVATARALLAAPTR